jgi:teichuronic acid biosynthesis glycosyltransferase TuaG
MTAVETAVHELVSVIMPAFNAERYVAEAIGSVLAQTYTNLELIVVDDCSDDTTARIAREFSDKDARVRVIQSEGNSGPGPARNVGIANARGRYIAFLDSDDLWLPQKLAIQIAAMRRTQASFCFSSYWAFRDTTSIRMLVRAPAEVTYEQMLNGSVIGCLTVVYDASVLDGCFFPDGKGILAGSIYSKVLRTAGHEDYALWLSILRRLEQERSNRVIGILEPLAMYRSHSQSFSGSKVKAALYQWIIYRRYLHLGIVKSLRCFVMYGLNGLNKHFVGGAH